VMGKTGTARSDGVVTTAEYLIGDASTNKGLQLFVVYDITGIPANATIMETKLDMRNGTIIGDPFGSLGVLHLYFQDFVPLNGTDYVSGLPSGGSRAEWNSAVTLGNVTSFSEIKTGLQSKLGSGSFQLRFQITTGTNSNGAVDAIQYAPSSGVLINPALIVKYSTP